MVEIALIAPYSQLHRCLNRTYQMLLPDPLAESEEYRRYAKYFGSNGNRGKYYVILDNGAAEDLPITPMHLLELAQEYHVQEIVVPDVLRNPDESFRLLETFLGFYHSYTSDKNARLKDTLHLMVPIHASGLEAGRGYIDAVVSLVRASDDSRMVTLGFPRDLLTTIDLSARIDLMHYAAREYPEYPLHMLGANAKWPTEVAHVYAKYVRSMDTSMVFNFTAERVRLSEAILNGISVGRPYEYFQLAATKFDTNLLKANLKMLDDWANNAQRQAWQVPGQFA